MTDKRTVTIELDADTARDLARLLELFGDGTEETTHGRLTVEGLAAMLLEDAGLIVSRPGCWEAANMAGVLESHGYAVE